MTQSALIRGIVLWGLSACAGVAAAASPANLFPNPDFARFDGDLPEGWTLDSWNQPMMKVRPGKHRVAQQPVTTHLARARLPAEGLLLLHLR